ncbi:protein of unknown function [Chishuiella changwenlii]|uniref:DUF4465 domain-containing protein n=1 Tax=Chishuiella changwenlii TaxID=1434701 RepID=A0A1M7A868_9FLAO|nr:DUF4465 domain-containing protein [Chishuiella changwenlii]GGF10035.1 hypothetical protein GCM10010984_28990 [Chishuiella changwenlii]SHL38880.1 protein of unknown function [Chishuiella changwenlii]
MKFNFTKKIFLNLLFVSSSILFLASCNNDDDASELVEQNVVTADVSKFDLSNGLDANGGKIWSKTLTANSELNVGIFNFSHDVTSWGSWTGFTVSNSNDNTDHIKSEGGWIPNQYGTMPKGGADGVGTPFLVSYADQYNLNGELKVGENIDVNKFSSVVKINDTTNKYKAKSVKLAISPWSYYGVLNGDQFARKFVKGDYFAIHIYGVSANNQITTAKPVTHYFVDFRNAVGNISTTWQDVDLSTLGEVKYLVFFLESTDMSAGYANTALYFTMDKLKVEKL